MSFQPVIIGTGLPAWNLLKSTFAAQRQLHASNPQTKSDTQYFKVTFDQLNTVDDIVSDRRVMRVILGAFGLSADIDNRHFIKTVMDQGTSSPDALANKLSDRRYKSLAESFDFSTAPPAHTLQPDLKDKVAEDFRLQNFEEAVGTTNNDMRLALSFQRSIEGLASSATNNSIAWFQVMATPPLREVIQTALGLPSEFSNLDVDEQQDRLVEKSKSVFGTGEVAELNDSEISEKVVQRFLVKQQVSQLSVASPLQTALVLLQSRRN